MRNIAVEILKNKPVAEQDVEIVERKGVGHPDYICDAVMESISVALSQEYMRRFGDILHHNIDKGLLVAGQVERKFGGGRVIKPIELIIGDRATFKVGNKQIDVEGIAIETAKKWFQNNLRFVDAERHVKYRVVLAQGSEELTDIFRRKGKLKGANDTSAAVGYAPFTPTEKAVYDAERFLNSENVKEDFPETGEDVKIMGLRRGRSLDLTIAMPLISRYVKDVSDYFKKKDRIKETTKNFVRERFGREFEEINIHYNTLDKKSQGLGGVYLSLLGTSAEDADSGQVGRGNRVNGVISLNRPMGTEAAAGKNPVSHVGKIYNILAHKLAKDIYDNIEGIKEVYVWLVSEIGARIDKPHLASAQVVLKKGVDKKTVSKKTEGIIENGLSNIGKFCAELAEGKYPVC
ncbi:MAG: methionine adenosyltransferase [Deltaproteobacteria bacterium]|nr:methionine adenosyltransferase [Deltaproteobacteria bacterium]